MGGKERTRLHVTGPPAPVGSTAFLTALLDSLSVGVAACDADGRLVVLNRALRETHRLGETEQDASVTGGDSAVVAEALFHPDGSPMALDQSPLARCGRGERVRDVDIVIRPPGQRSRTFSATGQPITGPDGQSLGAVVALHEVTATRRIGRFRTCHLRVLAALTQARSAADVAPEVLRAVAESLGWPHAELWLRDEVTGLLQQAGRFSDPSLDLDDLAGETVVKGTGVTGTVWHTGTSLWVPDILDSVYSRSRNSQPLSDSYTRNGLRTVIAVPILDGTDVLGVLTCFADTPEYQEDLITVLLGGVAAHIGQFLLLRRSEALGRELLRARDDFIALVGHELRTPLTTIAGYISLLDGDAGLDEEHRRMIHAVRVNTDTLRAIIDDLLDLAALESGDQPLTAAEIDLAAIGAEAVAAARPAAAVNHIRVTADLPAAMTINADPVRLRQAVDNVLSNAITYSHPGGHVHLRLSKRRNVIELRVTDNGIGIPRNERDQLFDRFYRATNVRHRGIRGNGLGLSLVRTIVEAHGGSVLLTNRGHTGTIALIRLPATPDPVPEQA